ncbi:unnamed protein product [Leuciscus chuanchicus]
MSQPSQLKPSTSRWSQGFQASGTVASQGFQTSGTATSQVNSPSQGSKSTRRLSTLTSAASPGQSFSTQDGSGRYSGLFSRSQSTSSQHVPASLVSKVPLYKPAAPSGSSLSQLSQWQPSGSLWSQGFQASGTVASQSSFPSQGSKSPNRFYTLTSAASPGQSFSNVYTSSSLSRAVAQLAGSSRDVPMQTGSTSADGSSLQLQGTSSQYAPAALDAEVPVYSQAAPSGFSSLSQMSQWQPSTSRWSQGFQVSGTVASQGFPTSGLVHCPLHLLMAPLSSFKVPPASMPLLFWMQKCQCTVKLLQVDFPCPRASHLNGSLPPLGGPKVFRPLVSKVPPYKPAAPSGSSSLSQPSHWQPSTTRWSQGFQASGTVASQSSSPSQGSKSPRRFSTLTSAANPGKSFSTQAGIVRYSGLSSQSQSASIQYNPGSPAYAKRGFSLLDSRQSTSDQSSAPQFSSGSSSMAALSLPVDSVFQSSQSSISNSWRTSSLSGVGLRPSMVYSKAASGSIRRQMSPGWFGSVQNPTDSTTYGQKPSWSSWRDFSSVKG